MFLLVVLFMIDGEPTIVDGWAPIQFEDRLLCEAGKTNVQIYLEVLDLSENTEVICGTKDEIQKEITLLNSELL